MIKPWDPSVPPDSRELFLNKRPPRIPPIIRPIQRDSGRFLVSAPRFCFFYDWQFRLLLATMTSVQMGIYHPDTSPEDASNTVPEYHLRRQLRPWADAFDPNYGLPTSASPIQPVFPPGVPWMEKPTSAKAVRGLAKALRSYRNPTPYERCDQIVATLAASTHKPWFQPPKTPQDVIDLVEADCPGTAASFTNWIKEQRLGAHLKRHLSGEYS